MTRVCALHGFTGTPRAFRELNLPLLWSPYLSGHGPDPDTSANAYADEVERICTGLKERTTEPVHLVAYSMGARLALGLIQTAPHLFTEATLIGVNPGLRSEEARQDRLGWEARWIDVLEQDGLAVFEHQWKKQPIFRTQHTIPPRSQDAQRSARLSHTATGLSHAMNVLGLGSMPNFWPHLPALKVPIRCVYGSKDDKFEAIAREAAQVAPRISATAIADVGHNPLLEAPRELRALILEGAGR